MFIRTLLFAAGLAALTGVSADAQHFGGHVELQNIQREGDLEVIAGSAEISGVVGGNLEIFAGSIEAQVDVGGDTHLAGGNVEISGTTRGDAEIGGGAVDVAMDIDGDADIGGGFVNYSGTIGGELDIAAGRFVLSEQSVITRTANISGKEVILSGRFLSNLEVFAEEVEISGQIAGDADIEARRLAIQPGAVIDGRLVYRGPAEPDIAADAVITGGVEYTFSDVDIEWDGTHFNFADLDLDIIPATPFFIAAGIAFDFILGVLALLLMPRGVARVSRKFRERPLLAPLVGLFLFPMGWVMLLVAGIVLLAITLVGIILIPFWVTFALLVLMLAYPLGVIAVSDFFLSRTGIRQIGTGIRMLGLLIVLILVAALCVVPPLAVIAGIILSWIGLGSWAFAAFGSKGEGPVDPAPAGGTTSTTAAV
ncbi:bactofilin family protein [Hyphobacterium sp.]|uniref:bactofilin family protein n=1 Tax=Hyphobacterium sp. TaxID=2004662 RepID=UPI003B52A483